MARLRLTPKCLLKFFICIVCLLFIVPIIFNFLEDHKSRERNEYVKKRLVSLFPDSYYKFQKNKTQLTITEEEPIPDLGPVSFGPKAYFRKNIIGNFEPDFPPEYGPGENGESVYLDESERAAADISVQNYGFNMVVSDKISMTRNIPDTRHEECKYWRYPTKLPNASVIIVFHNEGFSSLVRTIHSVVKTSPKHLLHEIIMVDDFSDKKNLKQELEDYLIKHFGKLVKLYRNPERMGLIGTRTQGAVYATGDVIIFLDAHCECNKNWLVPLLARINYDRTIMAVPTIDGIDWNTFHYSPVYSKHKHFRGIFEWGFLYKESEVPKKFLDERTYFSEPYKSPTHAGGLFAMDRKYFFELGAYDSGLQIWGGENFELSFKIWQCGGSIEWVPCSRVGHVYRNHMPYGFGKISPRIPIILINYMRVVEVWLDPEYREYFYTREPTIEGYPIGDISKQVEFKKQHKCRSFKWFIENVSMEVLDNYPVPPKNVGWGEIKLKLNNVCWDSNGEHAGGNPIGGNHCHHQGGGQLFRLNEDGQIGLGERCIDKHGSNRLSVHYCTVQPIGPWKLDKNTGHIRYGESGECVKLDIDSFILSLETCQPLHKNQMFVIRKIKTW